MKELTISDIANLANVSTSTVSRVLNCSDLVKEDTRRKVLSIIEREGYSPSAVAKNLSQKVSENVGVMVQGIHNVFFGNLLRGVMNVANNNGLIVTCSDSEDNMQKDMAAIDVFKNQRVRGLLYTPAIDYRNIQEKKMLEKHLKMLNRPVILMDRQLEGMEFDGVFFDDEKAINKATKALINAGHTKIAIINAMPDRISPRLRQKGYEDALLSAGLPVEQRYIFFGDYSMETAYRLSVKLLSMTDRPTAVITCNNWTSMGFIKAVSERGEIMPDDIACIGLDQLEVLDIANISFNYILRDSKLMGERAMELLINRMAFPERPKQTSTLEAPLVIKKL